MLSLWRPGFDLLLSHLQAIENWRKGTDVRLKVVAIIYWCIVKGRSFTANSSTKAALLPKGRSSIAIWGTQVAVLLRMNSFPLLSAPHSLFRIWTDLKRSQRHREEVRRVDLTNWALWTSPKFTTGVKYEFHQGFWADQRSRNPNHPSPPNYTYWYNLFLKSRKLQEIFGLQIYIYI